MNGYRIGFGEDIHRLVEGRKLVLSGVEIPFEKGLLGHSDADVVFHAVSDAVLGALAMGDIGIHFPPDDPKYDDCDSRIIIDGCVKMAYDAGYKVNNVDVMIICQKPRLAPYIEKMRKSLALSLGIEMDACSIKAGTNEGLDAIGEGKAISAKAVVSLIKE